MKPVSYKYIDDVAGLSYPLELTMVPQHRRFAIHEGVAYDDDGNPFKDPDIQKAAEGMHGIEGNLSFKEQSMDSFSPPCVRRLVFHVTDTFIDPQEDYVTRMDFHTGYRDRQTWYIDREFRKPCVTFTHHWFIENESSMAKRLDWIRENHWEGALIVYPDRSYGDDQHLYLDAFV